MHVRFTTVLGMPVTDDQMDEDIGLIGDMLIAPDTGAIEGFFVKIPSFLKIDVLFLSTADIQHFGSRIRVRSTEALAPIGDIVRLQSLLDDGRTFFGQRMMTESGRYLGVCRDVQFDTHSFQTEWFFPKKWWMWQRPVPRSAILEVRPDAILVRDSLAPTIVESPETVLPSLESLTGTPV